MNVKNALFIYLKKCELRNLAPKTLRDYQQNIGKFADFYAGELDELTQDHIDDYAIMQKGSGIKITTVNNRLRDLRAFLNWAHKSKYLPQRVDIPLLKNHEIEIVPFDGKQLKNIYEACQLKRTFTRQRDYLLMRILEETGCRITEALEMEVGNVILDTNTIKIQKTKNKKARHVYFTPSLKTEIKTYLEARQRFLEQKGVTSTRLFFATQASPCSKLGDPLACRSIEQNITRYGELAGITNVRVSPHTFRHTFARHFLINGGNMFVLQEILGHSSLEMVRRYVRLFDCDRKTDYMTVMQKYTKSKKRMGRNSL